MEIARDEREKCGQILDKTKPRMTSGLLFSFKLKL